MIAATPTGPVEVPPVVREIAGGRTVHAVWRNEVGGLTFQISAERGELFVKWSPRGVPLAPEVARLRWAAGRTPVPPVLDSGADEDGEWMVTAGLPGRSAVDTRWLAEPRTAVRAIGSGLRALHEALPVSDCPFDWSAERRLDAARARAGESIDPALRPPGCEHISTVGGALGVLDGTPSVDRLVVCHGDACAPNTLIGDDGRCTGHVDLGSLGVADRWADLAVATWATHWNYGAGWEEPLLEAYGVEPDLDRTAYYRLLWTTAD
ncbi:aminoglycoside 3'-phosphotransferase [Saccharopolyspora rhizosphaerae]|uniref:Aminoglycoside 3'-phosphotransferase n=1 Tax=Saccharopolyspora rhizosphaerae TaxID=2492662 RepID=A0A3R8P5C2_9PSEU|nr:aminoglycoside 3'-phosphotransferase [Saccharopolyspora rhizosphaerae]RRO16714.1 aminoglycoside 3'-phosphotransferase [Saccharopolyspora rhizosphaerae]